MTIELESFRAKQLDARIRRLRADDMRLTSWLNSDKFSTVWLTALPNKTDRLTNAEFAEVAARYYGAKSPACAPFVGLRLRGQTIDAYGLNISSASLPGDNWRSEHDALKWRMAQDAKEMGQHVNVEAYGLFAAVIPQGARQRLDELTPRTRHGLVPDFLMRLTLPEVPAEDYLLELKVAHLSKTWYGPSLNLNLPAGAAARLRAVKRRAEQVPRSYVAKAQKADQTYCGTPPGTVGPIEAKLRSYRHVIPLVFGAYGEASEGVQLLLSHLSECGAVRHWRRMKAKNATSAKGALVWLLRRRWGMTVLRENARLTLERLQYVGDSSTRKDERAAAAMAKSHTRCKARADALEFSVLGPNVGDTRPLAATRWA